MGQTGDKTELKQEDVFKYIDKELKSHKRGEIGRITQKTHSNFLPVLLINLIAILIAGSGFSVVYRIFKNRAYRLVGKESSIKGLQDVLLAELQKKANAELLKKQKELEDIKKKLNNINNQMDSFKIEQQRKLKAALAKKEKELLAKMNSELKNKSGKVQEEIRKKYEQQLASLNSRLDEQAKAQEQAYQKKLEEQRLALLNQQQQNQQSLIQTKAELSKNEKEFQRRIEEEKAKGRAALQKVTFQLQEKQKIDDFYFQVNQLFQDAIASYQKGQYDVVRKKLDGVLKLYQNKTADIRVSDIKENVDKFFVSSIKDYLALKEQQGNSAKMKEYVISLKNLDDFSSDLKRGVYNNKTDYAQKKIEELKKQLPQVFEFYSAYKGYGVLLSDIKAQKELNLADRYYAEKDYENAAKAYLSVLQKYPNISQKQNILSRLSTSLIAGSDKIKSLTVAPDFSVTNQFAKRIFNRGLNDYKRQNFQRARKRFENVILKYPNSDYTVKALEYIAKIHKNELDREKYDPALVARAQDKMAAPLFSRAQRSLSESKYNEARAKLAELILKYPQSSYTSKSLNLMNSLFDNYQTELSALAKNTNRVMSVLTQIVTNQGLQTSPSGNGTALFLSKNVGRIVDIIGNEIILDLSGGADVKTADSLYIMRKSEGNVLNYLGEAEVTRVSPVVSKAKITKKVAPIRVGDLLFMK